jgi:RHS repeat-associated protein
MTPATLTNPAPRTAAGGTMGRSSWRGLGLALLGLLWAAPLWAQMAQIVEYYHTDALGSVRAVTRAGVVVSRHDFMPFGEEVQPPLLPVFKRLFLGKERDTESGVDYFEARYYRPQTGRFSTVDPGNAGSTGEDPQSWAPYGYGRGNPLKYVDLSGQDYCVAIEGGREFCMTPEEFDTLRANPGAGIVLTTSEVLATVDGRLVHVGDVWYIDPLAGMLYQAGRMAAPVVPVVEVTMGAFGGIAGGAVAGFGLLGGGTLSIANAGAGAAATGGPLAVYGRQIINGIEYSAHALERMAPVGIGGRGVPVSAVENAIRCGRELPGNTPGTVLHVFENVTVVTNTAGNFVISVIKTGH